MNVLAILAKAIRKYIKNVIEAMVKWARVRAEAARVTAQAINTVKSVRFDTKFTWHAGGPAKKYSGRIDKAQAWLDNEVLKDCEEFTPLRTGTLIRTGIAGTHIGAGQVKWIAPYANSQYKNGRKPGMSQTGPLRGRYWFERAKQVHKDKWIRGVKQIIKNG